MAAAALATSLEVERYHRLACEEHGPQGAEVADHAVALLEELQQAQELAARELEALRPGVDA